MVHIHRPAEVEHFLLAHRASEYENPLARRNFTSPRLFSKIFYEGHFSIQRIVAHWVRVEEKERRHGFSREDFALRTTPLGFPL